MTNYSKSEAIAVVMMLTTLIAMIIYVQVGVWNECRETHSFFYCANLLAGK